MSGVKDSGLPQYSSKGLVLERHCTTLFIKQVFPIFLRPLRPENYKLRMVVYILEQI